MGLRASVLYFTMRLLQVSLAPSFLLMGVFCGFLSIMTGGFMLTGNVCRALAVLSLMIGVTGCICSLGRTAPRRAGGRGEIERAGDADSFGFRGLFFGLIIE